MDERTAGIDLASEEHRLVVVGSDGRRLEERRFAHSEDGVSALVRRLLDLEVARVALEQPNGLVVDRLLDAGLAVVAVHPNQLAAARDRYRSGGGKSDGFDGYVLAERARTDMHRLRLLAPDRDQTRALRVLTRAREDLVEQRVALANQLRAQLEAFWPGAARVFFDVDSPIALAFLERYPSPGDTRGLGAKRLASFLARNGYCGRKSAAELRSRLRSAPEGRAGELESETRRAVVLGLVAALKPLVEQIRLLTSEIRGLLADHPDGQIFRSLFRDPKSVVTAAELLAEIGDRRDRHRSSSSLEAVAGQSAVAVESGKRKIGSFRWACNKTLRSAVAVLADSSRKHTPWARRSTPTRSPAARTTRTPCGSSAAHGCASSGPCGKTAPLTTPSATAASPASSRPGVDTGRLTPASSRAALRVAGVSARPSRGSSCARTGRPPARAHRRPPRYGPRLRAPRPGRIARRPGW